MTANTVDRTANGPEWLRRVNENRKIAFSGRKLATCGFVTSKGSSAAKTVAAFGDKDERAATIPIVRRRTLVGLSSRQTKI